VDVENIKTSIMITELSTTNVVAMIHATIAEVVLVGAAAMVFVTYKEIGHMVVSVVYETCQVCGMVGHIALACWKRFQKNYRGPEKLVGAAYGSYGFDSN
jgi:hypothetical protein